jgi:hypothetical protein
MVREKSFDTAEEFGDLDFHSLRLENRFIRTMKTLEKQPEASIWWGSENRAEAKTIYRMLGNERFDREGDMYELFAKAEALDEAFLIRIVQNRMTVENKGVLDEIRKKRCQGRVRVSITEGQPERYSGTGGGTPDKICWVYDKAAAYPQSS